MSHPNAPPVPSSWEGPYKCVPFFSYEFDANDREESVRYCRTLQRFRLLANARPLRSGDSFAVSILPLSPSPSRRLLPPFALEGGSLQLTLETGFQTGSGWCSEVWGADVRRPGGSASLGKVVMKIFLSSLLSPPDPNAPRHPCMNYINPRTLAGTENLVYDELRSFQGSIIPYYYGFHKLEMPHGEIALVVLLEYVEGQTVAQWLKSYPPHEMGPALNPTLKEDYLYKSKLLISVLRAFNQINEQDVIHFDARPENMIVTPGTHELVIVDFADANLRVPPEMVRRGNDAYNAVDYLMLCCEEHRRKLKEWSETGLPDRMVKPRDFFNRND